MKRDCDRVPVSHRSARDGFVFKPTLTFSFLINLLAAVAILACTGCASHADGNGEHIASTNQAIGEQTCTKPGGYCGSDGSNPAGGWYALGCGDGHCGTETWFVTGLPSGVTATISPATTTLTNPTTITLNIGTSVPAGEYTFQLGASSLAGSTPGNVTLIVMDMGEELGPKGCCNNTGSAAAGEPIDIGSGNVTYEYTDYTTAGQNPLAFTRYYNSLGNAYGISTFAAEMGVNWRSTYDRYIQIASSSKVIVERAGGQQLTFNLVGSTWTPNKDVNLSLTHSGTTWTLTDVDDTVETYTTTSGGNEALLNTIVLRNGYTQTTGYNTSNQLTSVTDSYSRALSFTYNTSGTLATVGTPDSTTISYGYTSATGGYQLTSASFPTSTTQTVTYIYGNSGLPFALTGITDENGHGYASWTYDSVGRGLTSQLGSGANLVTLVYNTDGSRTVTNASGVTDTYTFTTLQTVPKVSQISRAATGTTAAATRYFTYDSNGYLSSQSDWNGNQTSYVNNSQGLPGAIYEAAGSAVQRTTQIVYSGTFPHLPDRIITDGVRVNFTYDSAGNELTRTLTDTTTTSTPYSTNGQTRTWTNTWSNHLLASVETPNSNTTTLGYDTDGSLISVTDALSHTTSVTSHTGGGRPLTVVDPNSVTTTFTYDARQRLLTSAVTMSGGTRTTTYDWDPTGTVAQTTLADGSYIANTYDTAHRLTRSTDATGDYTTYTLDALGDKTATGVYHWYGSLYALHGGTFDALGRALTDVGGRSQTTTFTRDANGNALTVTDGLSNTTTNTFDALNRLSTSTDAASGVVTRTYDAHDRVLTVTDALSHTTSYVYNGFGDVIQVTSPDTGTTVYHYDADGNVTQKVDAASVTMNATWDALDRPLTRSYPADSTQNVSFTYDQTSSPHTFGIGRLTSVTDAAGSVSLGYDERGATTFKRRTVSSTNYDMSFGYNAAGRPTDITYPSGLHAVYGRYTQGKIGDTNAYLPFVSGMGSPYTTFAYTGHGPFGPVDYITYGNGVTGPITRDYDYSIAHIQLTDGSSTTIQDLTYTLDGANNVTAIADALDSTNDQTLGYDALNRLTSATSGSGGYGSHGWSYDANGNLTSQTLYGQTFSYTLTSGTNRLASATFTGGGTESFGYTATGNTSSVTVNGGTVLTASYNVANRAATITPTGGTAYTSLYGFDGKRVKKTDSGGTPIIYSYDLDGNLVEETDGTNATDYVYVEGWLIGLYEGNVSGGTGGSVYYVHPDRTGNPALVTDGSMSNVWSANYNPYGVLDTGGGSITQNAVFPGQYLDAESGLYQNGFRTYKPEWGRYLEADPIGLDGGMNPYLYAGANPGAFVDLEGLAPQAACVAAYSGAGLAIGGLACGVAALPTGPGTAGAAAAGAEAGAAAGAAVGLAMCPNDSGRSSGRFDRGSQSTPDPDDDDDRQRNGRPGDRARQKQQVESAARDEGLDADQRRKLGRAVEEESRERGASMNYHDIREMARDIKNSR
jgi:RHS repeat-associated protein